DTIWFPERALAELPDVDLSFLLFPVEHPEFFDSVLLDGHLVREIAVKQADPPSHWIWGAFRMSGRGYRDLNALWKARARRDEYFGTLVNSYLAAGGQAAGVKAGESYVDVGTLDGYRAAMTLLQGARKSSPSRFLPAGSKWLRMPATAADGVGR
ncbi:MAG: nucleotidyltransferase, partial [Thermoleophilia bacterium]|nr:nucleotidyltransferase [Thermoleophilia bacterium]